MGDDRKKVAKLVVTAACEGGKRLRIVRRNLPIDRLGGFTAEKLTPSGDLRYSVGGAWETKKRAFGEVDLMQDSCPPGGFGYLTSG